ncbi:MAG: CYTH domain-containing protein [Nanoarchaeota archaeon]|nr:CYTH domain-containing protein [Nanoarchaeota archaeon]MBU4123969.1 CYTH domain-containing protein [Nanoarchaeota archaeon]
MKDIETEVRSFLTKEQYDKLLDFFKKNGEFVKKDYQITYYFTGEQDLRIQKNDFFSKIWLKGGKIHDDFRKELEIICKKEDFKKAEELFTSLGYEIKIKWFRDRQEFKWEGIDVMIDFTKGYGYIIELEQMCSENEKEKVIAMLKEKMKKLEITITPKEEFDAKFKFYSENWKTLIN